MKILLYSHYFVPSIGGVETIVLSLARGLTELRTSKGEQEFTVLLATQTPAGDYGDRSLPFQVVRQPGLEILWRLVRQSDVVHIAGAALTPMFFTRLAGKPLVIEHHGYQAICPNGLLVHQPDGGVCPGHFLASHYGECRKCLAEESSPIRSWMTLLFMFPRHFLARRASANILVSDHVLHRCSLPRSSVVYHGIDDPLSGTRGLENIALRPGRICFAYVGRLVAEKGVSVLLEAARLLREEDPNFGIRLIGDGPERPRLEAIIARDRLESHVQITGFLGGSALDEAVRGAQVVVMPSIWEETAGLAAIEQMMRRRLVIVSDIGGLGEIVGESGLKFPPGDARALAKAMRSVLLQPSLIESFGKLARERALGQFRRATMIAQHAMVYRRVCL